MHTETKHQGVRELVIYIRNTQKMYVQCTEV